jgi:resuscitation-promoting factor RpfA
VATGVDHQEPHDEALDRLIAAADLDGLIRLVDARCATADWAGLLHIRDRSRWAVTTGRQLWPAATMAEYRLALLAPTEWAARVLDEETGRFSIGPLTEVVAQSHTWESLSRLVTLDPRAAFVAHERAIRGEVIDTEDLPDVLNLPYELEPWEPQYPVATYAPDGATFDAPELPTEFVDVDLSPGVIVQDDDVTLAVRQLVEPWTAQSNGKADIVCVEGTAAEAVGALGLLHARIASMTAQNALQWLAWAGASGGAFGRRRGAAQGRFGAWWVVAALGGALDEWPLTPHAVGDLVEELQWYWWDAHEPPQGWELQLAVALPSEGLAWAISARDAA